MLSINNLRGFLSLIFCVATILLVASCEREDRLLIGKWNGVSVTENGDSLKLDPSEISFEFTSGNRYFFTSTLRYREAGTWRYDNGYLFAQDTTQPTNPERVVAIELMNEDSLVMRMQADSAERRVVLLRSGRLLTPQ